MISYDNLEQCIAGDNEALGIVASATTKYVMIELIKCLSDIFCRKYERLPIVYG